MGRKFLIHSMVVLVVLTMTLTTGCRKGTASRSTGTGASSGAMGDAGDIPPLGGAGDIAVGDRGMAMSGTWKHGEFAPVYFDFDSARVRPSELPKLETVAAKARSGVKLVVEGHADERGTAEYNRALGERRALACREELIRLGVAAGNISTISYGEERPAALGHDEAAWAENRRCEFVTVQ